MSYLVAIVGRPNVGKSTLFNRLTGSREAIVDPEYGVTRDRKYGKSYWGERTFEVVDTGGVASGSNDHFDIAIIEQVKQAIEEADCVVFMVDGIQGLTDWDKEVAKMIRQVGKKTYVVVNKVDTSAKEDLVHEFYEMGMDAEFFPISANNGYGTGDLLDSLILDIPDKDEEEEAEVPQIAIVGKPNVGKSSLLNNLLGWERSIVTEVAGTTRDAIKTRYDAFGFEFDIVDTAGLRKNKDLDNIEFYSYLRTMRSIEQSDVCMLLIDAQDGLTKQDLSLFYHIKDEGKGVVLVINKWDLIDKETGTLEKFRLNLKEQIAPYTDVPIVFTSNVTKQRLLKAFEAAIEVHENRSRRIPTSRLNDVLLDIIEFNPPPSLKGKYVKIKYITQLPTVVPSIAFYCNLPQYVKDAYKRFLENQIREYFDFTGVPIRLYFRKK